MGFIKRSDGKIDGVVEIATEDEEKVQEKLGNLREALGVDAEYTSSEDEEKSVN